MTWKKEFDTIYPLQVWAENNKEQAIVISPTLQKVHKEKIEQFIQDLLDKQKEEIQDLIVDEMTIAHEEGTPTSRLTSLFSKLNEQL